MNLEFLTPTFIISVLVALSVHEWAHGYAAYKLGDPTAKYEGRLTLNPISHLDPIGTLLFVLVGFGWGKPVPVNPQYFKNYKRDTALVALAGPASNLVLASIGFIVLLLIGKETTITGFAMVSDSSVMVQFLTELMVDFLQINLVLMAFNLLPIAPLDGSKILRPFIPLQYDQQYENFMANGPKILLILIILSQLFHLPVFSLWINTIIAPVLLLFSVVSHIF